MRVRHPLVAAAACLLAGLLTAGPFDAAHAQEAQPAAGSYEVELDLSSLSVEELTELLARAAAARLKVERDTVASEIKGDLLYEESDKAEALRVLGDNPANTQGDNIDRICRAFAAADEEFAEGYEHFAAGRHDAVLERMKAILDPQQATYLSAACHYVHAEALFRLGRYDDAVETYRTILTIMPDRISFASASASRCAEAYEKMNRFYYATEIYMYCIREYSLTMSDQELEKIVERLKYLRGIYEDPLGAVSERMGDVRLRLDKLDSGEATREKQKEIAAILEDLIKSAEEQQGSKGGSSSSSGRKRQPKKAGSRGSAKPQPKGGRASGRARNPAQRGFLPPGIAQRPGELAEARSARGTDDWARLPKSKRDEIDDAVRRLLPERYRKLIQDYRKDLSKAAIEPEE